jgi:hypothetical protein
MKRNKSKRFPPKSLRQKSRALAQAASTKEFETLFLLGRTPGGFVSDKLRRIIWPLLLGLENQQLNWSVETSGPFMLKVQRVS